MEVEQIELDQTGQYPRFVTDYLKMVEGMEGFIEHPPTKSGIAEYASKRTYAQEMRSVLIDVLKEQHEAKLTEKQKNNIHRLSQNNTFSVCTGHQLCLFGGPVYMLYKIASTIKLAEQLSADNNLSVVPIFWMASEDHDIAEIDHCSLFGRRFHYSTSFQGPAANLPLTDIEEVLKELGDVLGDSSNALTAKDLIQDSYGQAKNMAEGFRNLIQNLFGGKGLLILDAADKKLKSRFSEMMRLEINESLIEKSMGPALEMIEHRGEKVQASARDINLFYMTKDSRTRLSKEDGADVSPVEGEKWTGEQWKDLLENSPEDFSPNVLFRPIYQEFILPNLAYIGGPGELSYWLQLKDVFRAFDLKLPVLVLRDSMMWLDDRTESKWHKLGFKVLDFFRDEDMLYKEFAKRSSSGELNLGTDRESIIRHFDKIIDRSTQIDPSIVSFAKAERTKLLKSIENLEKKMIRAEKKKHSNSLSKISTLKNKFLPGGSLRERKENFLHWYLKYGEEFIDMLLEVSEPLDARLKVVKA